VVDNENSHHPHFDDTFETNKMADVSKCPPLNRESVIAAHELIKEYIHYTPVLTNHTLDELASTPQQGIENPARPKIRLWFKVRFQVSRCLLSEPEAMMDVPSSMMFSCSVSGFDFYDPIVHVA